MINRVLLIFVLLLFAAGNFYSQGIEQVSGVTVSLNSVSSFDNANAWVCGASGTVLRTTNGGNNWVNVTGNGIPVNLILINIFAVTPSIVLAAGYAGSDTWVYRTTNNGTNWSQVFSQPGGFIDGIVIKNDSTGLMYGDPVGGRWSLWKTTNRGATWDSTGLYLPQAGAEYGYNNTLVIAQSKVWFGTNNSRIYYSTNNGTNWSVQGTAPETDITSIWFDPNGSATGYFGSLNVYKTSNYGVNWANIGSLGTQLIIGLTGFPMWTGNVMYVRNASNVIYQGFGTGQWYSYYTAPAGTYTHITVDRISGFPITGFAVRSNGGITKFNFFVEGINNLGGEIPKQFSLSQNYPNPFNPVTKVKFQIPNSGFVKLMIYDILGRVVKTVVDQELTPGTYEVSIHGSTLSSGVYYYKLETEGFTETKKMILIHLNPIFIWGFLFIWLIF
jgi:photosystem II stability/assembly factor-like uncharacterized protein